MRPMRVAPIRAAIWLVSLPRGPMQPDAPHDPGRGIGQVNANDRGSYLVVGPMVIFVMDDNGADDDTLQDVHAQLL